MPPKIFSNSIRRQLVEVRNIEKSGLCRALFLKWDFSIENLRNQLVGLGNSKEFGLTTHSHTHNSFVKGAERACYI